MDRPRLIRGLRIVWSVVWRILCVLLIVLWVRSRSWSDEIYTRYPTVTKGLTSSNSSLTFTINRLHNYGWNDNSMWGWHIDSTRLRDIDQRNLPGFVYWKTKWLFQIIIAYRYLVPTAAILAAIPWVCRRFSLRTLLIATTLIAVLLATAAYLRLW